jgi:hypothetical protein
LPSIDGWAPYLARFSRDVGYPNLDVNPLTEQQR